MIEFIITFTNIILLSSAVIAAVLLIRYFFASKLRSFVLSVLWIAVLTRLIIPFTFSSPVDISNIFNDKQSTDTSITDNNTGNLQTDSMYPDNFSEEYIADDTVNINTTDEIVSENSTLVQSENTNSTSEESSLLKEVINTVKTSQFLSFATIIWLIGAWITLLLNIRTIFNFSNKVKLCNEINNKSIRRSLTIAKTRLGIKQRVKVLQCEFIDTPVTCGLISPKILLPAGFSQAMNNEKLYLIILHELCHIKNRDILKNYLWLIARIVYWFNPLVAISYNEYLEDIEYIADEKVLECLNGQSTLEYTQSLLDAVKFSNINTKVPVALSFCTSKSKLRKRVEVMLNPQKKSKLAGIAILALCFVLVFASFTTACIKRDDINTSAEITENNEAVSEEVQIQETPAPTTTTPQETESIPVDQPIKRNPLGSEEAAIAVAESINVSNADSFTYIGYSEDRVPNYHMIQSNDDTHTHYMIYEFNGELRYLQTSVFTQDPVGEELSTDELMEKVKEFAYELYPNTELTLTNCEKEDFSWEYEGETYYSNEYIATGELYDNVDGSIRKFTSNVRLDGKILSIKAEYSGLDYMELSDDVRNKILSYAETNNTNIDLFQRDEYYNDYMLHFKFDNDNCTISLLESDMSVIDYLNISNETDVEYSLTNSKAHELAQQYADFIFPDNTSVVIDDEEVMLGDYVGEGTLTDSRGTMDFYIVLNGNGDLHKIGIKPNVDKTTIEKVEKAAALQTAINTIKDDCPFVDESRLKTLSIEEYENQYHEAYKFEFEYTSLNPTIYDYSFNAYIDIDVHSGEPFSWRVDYIEDGLNLITQEEAIQKAKEYIVAEYDVDPDKLVYKEFIVMTGRVLEFQANFDYEDGISYGASMLADTGELDGIGFGSN